MDVFHWIVVPISTVLGLTFARILAAYVSTFKNRQRVTFDWLPLAIAGAVLGEGLQFWWALLELSSITSWSLAAFTLLVAMVLTLFTAGALIVPSDTDLDLRVAFERDGRWALIALACFHILAIIANAWFWNAGFLRIPQGLSALLAGLAATGGLTRNRFTQNVVIVLYLAVSVIDTLTASAAIYE